MDIRNTEIKPMEVTLKKAVHLMCGNDKRLSLFKYYLKRSLRNVGCGNLVLREGEIVEFQDGFVSIVFTWDMISAVNNLTNEYVDLINPEKAFEVFD